MSPRLHQRCGGTQLNGFRFMEDDCWHRFLFQCQDIQFRLQHSLEVLQALSSRLPHLPGLGFWRWRRRETLWIAPGRRRGRGPAVTSGVHVCGWGASWRRPQPVGTGAASGTRWRSAAGNLWAPLRPPVGAQLRRLRSSARATAPRPLPPPPSTIRTCAL